MAKVYDKSLARIKRNEFTNAIVDKSIIKNGMIVTINNNNYVKVGRRLVRITLDAPLEFETVLQEQIQMVYKPNGEAIIERIEEDE